MVLFVLYLGICEEAIWFGTLVEGLVVQCHGVINQSISQLSKCLISVSTDSKAHHPVRKA